MGGHIPHLVNHTYAGTWPTEGHKRERERPRPKSLTSAPMGLPGSYEEAEGESLCQTVGAPGPLAGSWEGVETTAAFSGLWKRHFSTIFRMWNFKDSPLSSELLKTRTHSGEGRWLPRGCRCLSRTMRLPCGPVRWVSVLGQVAAKALLSVRATEGAQKQRVFSRMNISSRRRRHLNLGSN